MEIAMSAVAGELANRFISFLANKYHSSREPAEQKVLRLQRLLMRVCTVVEEADARYVTNFGMQMQLQMLSQAMYRGHQVLDSFNQQALRGANEAGDAARSPLAILPKRFRPVDRTRDGKVLYHLELHSALESLEAAVANMEEFVVLLSGCENMSRRPYDTHLYIENFMFARHVEKQKLLSFLLQHNSPSAPAVLPIIGGPVVGKKTLVAHVCHDDRVRSHFSSILHLNGDNFLSILDHDRSMSGMTLLIVEFVSDVDDEDWKKFYSFVTQMARGSKVIIVSRHERLTRFGSIKPILLNILSYDEFWYLFKTLTFGSADPAQYPQLVQIADEIAKEMQLEVSLVAVNAFADLLRRNLSVQFWLGILTRAKKMIQRNLSMYGVPPKLLFREGHLVDITDFVLHSPAPIRVIFCAAEGSSRTNDSVEKMDSPKVTLGDLMVDPTIRPKGEFILLSWKSRIPPYTTFAEFVPSCAQDMPQGAPLSGRKRRGEPI